MGHVTATALFVHVYQLPPTFVLMVDPATGVESRSNVIESAFVGSEALSP